MNTALYASTTRRETMPNSCHVACVRSNATAQFLVSKGTILATSMTANLPERMLLSKPRLLISKTGQDEQIRVQSMGDSWSNRITYSSSLNRRKICSITLGYPKHDTTRSSSRVHIIAKKQSLTESPTYSVWSYARPASRSSDRSSRHAAFEASR